MKTVRFAFLVVERRPPLPAPLTSTIFFIYLNRTNLHWMIEFFIINEIKFIIVEIFLSLFIIIGLSKNESKENSQT
jgi:hypothetical protein